MQSYMCICKHLATHVYGDVSPCICVEPHASCVSACVKSRTLNSQGVRRIKSLANPDQRVEIIKGFAKKNFKASAGWRPRPPFSSFEREGREGSLLSLRGSVFFPTSGWF